MIAAALGDPGKVGAARAVLDLPVWRAMRAEPGARELLADALGALAAATPQP